MPRAARPIAAALLLLPAACLVKLPVEETVYSPCHALASSDWRAHVIRIPSAHVRPIMKPFLVVEGKVTVPGAGYSVSLDLGPVERLDGPVQQILVRTTPPDGAEAGPPVVQSVRGTFPARKRYSGLRIRCGDGTLALVRDIPREP